MSPAPPSTSINEAHIASTEVHVRAILASAFEHTEERSAIVVWDGQCELTLALTEAYRRCLPGALFIDFDNTAPEVILAAFEQLKPSDLVVLVQSTSFRLHSFRIRMELFRRSLKVLEHPHLSRMPGAQALIYLESLAYDTDYYRGVGRALQEQLTHAQTGVIHSGGEQLVFPAGFEAAKVNIGDYTGMQSIGGQYPIGEVFTESKDLEAVNGKVVIALFGDTAFHVNRPGHPITLVVEKGHVIEALHSTPEFDVVLDRIRADDGEIWMRELGFGMNRAFSLERTVDDVGSFERMCGVHLSLGSKHAMYNKPNIRKKKARQHVDVFVQTTSVTLDGKTIFEDGAWRP